MPRRACSSRRQKAPGLRPTAAAFAPRRVMHCQCWHGAPLRSACVALGAPPCATVGHGEMLLAHLAPRKRAPKRVSEGGASNIHDQAGRRRLQQATSRSISFSELHSRDLFDSWYQSFSQVPVILTAVRITGTNLANAP